MVCGVNVPQTSDKDNTGLNIMRVISLCVIVLRFSLDEKSKLSQILRSRLLKLV